MPVQKQLEDVESCWIMATSLRLLFTGVASIRRASRCGDPMDAKYYMPKTGT